MFLSSISVFCFATILAISIDAMPSSSVNQIDDSQANNGIDENEIQQNQFTSWLYKRSSPLCDYRLQSRPLPLTSALCGYGHSNKGIGSAQMSPFKYG